MLRSADVEIVGQLLAGVYHRPETTEVTLEPPPPYEEELEEEYVETTRTDGGEVVKTLRKRRIQVEISAADYPVRTVKLRRVRRVQRSEEWTEDAGPSSEYLLFSVLVWVLSAVAFVLLLSTSVLVALLVAAIGAEVGVILFRYLQKTCRRTITNHRMVDDFEAYTEEVKIPVDESYAPRTETREIPNPERVLSIARVELPFTALEAGSGVAVCDPWGLFEPPRLLAPVIEDKAGILSVCAQLDDIKALPVILSGDREDIALKMETSFRDGVPLRGEELCIFSLFDELCRRYRSLSDEELRPNLVPPDADLVPALEPAHEAQAGGGNDPAGTAANEDLIRLLELLEPDDELARRETEFLTLWAENQAALSLTRLRALHQEVGPLIREFGPASHYSSFHFYCPRCLDATVQQLTARDYSISSEMDTSPVIFDRQSRCVFDPDGRTWRCLTCETLVEQPFPVHKLLDEVLFPAYDRLIAEHKSERLKLDSQCRDREVDYRSRMDREAEELRRDHQHEVSEVQTQLRLIEAEIRGDVEAMESLGRAMNDYQLRQSQAISRIRSDAAEVEAAIVHGREELVQRSEAWFRNMLGRYQEEMHELAVSKRREDLIRDACYLQTFQRMTSLLGDIRDSSRETADNTADIRVSSRETADNTADIRVSSRETANNTADIRVSSRKTADNTAKSNAIAVAKAEKEGIDLHDHAWYRVDKSVGKFFAKATNAVMGGSSIDRARRVGEAVRN